MTLQPCKEPFCGRVAAPKGRGRCEVHATERNRETHRTGRIDPKGGRIYGLKKWQVLRRRKLFQTPLCEMCGEIATDVHHRHGVEADPWSLAGLESLCHSCHSHVTRKAQIRGEENARSTR